MKRLLMISIVVLLATPSLALAHEADGGGFVAGLGHPVLGFDHLLAMVSVGILSAQIGGRAIWTVPMAFVLTMAVGGLLGMAGIHILSVELGIAFSVLALGIALAAEKKLPVVIAMIFVAIFAIFHGHAHGTEMPALASPLWYAAGFLLGTAAIHLGGVSIGAIAQQTPRGTILLRFAGAGIAGIGLHLMIG